LSSARKSDPPSGRSPSGPAQGGGCLPEEGAAEAPGFPVETEIFILPDGRVVVVDLPAELAGLVEGLGTALVDPADQPVGTSM